MNNQQKLQHLYWRAGFGLPYTALRKANTTTEQAIQQLFRTAKKIKAVPSPKYDVPSKAQFERLSPKAKQEKNKVLRQLVADLNSNWVLQMVSEDSNPLVEKMALFWHGHFACESKRVDFAVNQLNILRTQGLGKFRDLVVAIAKDAAMIMYLNNQQNRKNKPNENFARELLELFTIGRGHYTEQDVKEAARAFTGWFANRFTGEFEFKERQHDVGEKVFMGKTGYFDGEDIIDIILDQKQTAVYLVTKIYRYFVNPTLDANRVEELANLFYKSNYDIGKLMQFIFESEWFYASANVGAKIKSPVEFLVGFAKVLNMKFSKKESVLFTQRALGQVLFHPPNVAGWKGGENWIDNATLMLRMNMAAIAFERAELNIQFQDQPEQKTIKQFKKLEVTASIDQLQKLFRKEKYEVQALADFLLQNSIATDGTFIEELAQYTATADDKFKFYLLGIMSLPEYQMC